MGLLNDNLLKDEKVLETFKVSKNTLIVTYFIIIVWYSIEQHNHHN